MSVSAILQAQKQRKTKLRQRDAVRLTERMERLDQETVALGIPGMPLSAEFNPTSSRCTTRSIKRILTADRSPADWSTRDIDELIYQYNTIASLLERYPDYKTPQRKKDAITMLMVLEAIRERRKKTGSYGINGDEWKALRRVVTDLQSWLATVPTARVAAAEQHVDRVARRQSLESNA